MRQLNKKKPHTIYGKPYTWPEILSVVRAELEAQGHNYVTSGLSMALVIRKIWNPKHKDSDAILLEYARWLLKKT